MAFHVGCTFGGSFSSFASGRLFERSGPMTPWYMNLFFGLCQAISYGGLAYLFKEDRRPSKTSSSSKAGPSYRELRQMDEDEEEGILS